MRALIITWIVTLGLIVVVAIWLELSYEPATPPIASPPASVGPSESRPAAGSLDREPVPNTKTKPETIAHGPPVTLPPDIKPDPGHDQTPPPPDPSGQEVAIETSAEVPQRSVAPIPELSEPGPYGPLPVTHESRQPWQVYGLEFDRPADTPLIAIVLTHFGLGTSANEDAIAGLPQEITFAVSPYGRNLQASVEELRRRGHEVTLMIPMEPRSYPAANPGPHTLLASGRTAENIDRLHYVLSRLDGYVGLVVEMGSRFTAEYEAVRPIMADLSRRGLLFLDTSPRRTSRAGEIAVEFGIPHDNSDLFIDNDPAPEPIAAYLADLELIARREGTAVGMGRVSYAATVEQLTAWAASLAGREIALAPLSAVVRRQQATR